ncbi:BadF/BadG/BcrA/BcrD ATPase family protein [Kitasatospora sp. GP82]|uniref:N-acetylglucosamine kinase n=1 Tax=Kitasatospora sp. GP82 TaxID=3035089 RepID=UPI002474991E|nr:BadF/BadG/BcrA/BcrD ATPase family protein [Kitasatospora sp. GP82]MDH6125760.1 glucosamine kinase [Kitasatospora sp. GP82]
MSTPLVLGLDVGGTATRVVVADLDGRVVGAARGDGGNPVSHGGAAASRSIADSLDRALAGVDPARVAAGVLGLAGGLVSAADLTEVWSAAGLTVAPRQVTDVELAFAAGTSSPVGSVLISGTGAVAGECRDFNPVRLADGHGWLLGDRGSGYWLGHAAVRLALARIDRGERLTGPARAVVDGLLGVGEAGNLRSALIKAVHAEAPVRLARLAPMVLRAAEAGEPEALALVEEAAGHLLATLGTVRAVGSVDPVVLAGGVLSPSSPLAAAVGGRIAEQWPGAEITFAGNAAGAAAWLAARSLAAPGLDGLHQKLVGAL